MLTLESALLIHPVTGSCSIVHLLQMQAHAANFISATQFRSSAVFVLHSALALGLNEATTRPRASLPPESPTSPRAILRRNTCQEEEYCGKEKTSHCTPDEAEGHLAKRRRLTISEEVVPSNYEVRAAKPLAWRMRQLC